MDEKTTRKYRKQGKLPSELDKPHTWRTRPMYIVYKDSWDGIKSMLEINPGLEAKTIFDDLQRRYPGRFFGVPCVFRWYELRNGLIQTVRCLTKI
jgi:hypothetical protein